MTVGTSPTTMALLTLMQLEGIGRRTALKIVNGRIDDVDLEELRSRLSSGHRNHFSKGGLLDAQRRSEDQLDQGEAIGIRAFSIYEEEYPKRLREIYDPPAVLFVKGSIDSLHAPKSLAVVGTRRPTSYGEKVAQKAAHLASEGGFVIVSGLANGCDTYAHKGCLEAQGIGVAVLAHGLDKVYPSANRRLAEQLVETGGCLVSEYPVGMTPARTAFAERDRIQSGLSDAVLVIETDVKGGTMHTVRFALEQKRLIACIDHPEKWLTENKTRGNQKLIRENKVPAISNDEALRQLLHTGVGSFNEYENLGQVKEDSDNPQGVLAFSK